MKFPIILCSAFFVAALFDAGSAASETAMAKQPSPTDERITPISPQSFPTASPAMRECAIRYGGRFARGRVMRDHRWAYVEACFKEKTGMYPWQAHENCPFRYC
jgi:hypothetical protein